MDRLEPRLPPGVEAGIGRFIANFALLEEHLRGVICELGRTSAPAGEILTSELSFRGLVECFGALVREYIRDAQFHQESDDLLKGIDAINEFRNRLVHSLWVPDESSRVFASRQKPMAKRKRGFVSQVERVRRRDLLAKCGEVATLTAGIADFYDRIVTQQHRQDRGDS